jgi:putative adenylate-forming enzyme
MSRLHVSVSWVKHRLRRFRSRAQLERYQRHRLEIMARHAFEASPFYRERLGEPSLKALLEMAPLDKATMMAHFDAFNTAGVSLDAAMAVALAAEADRNFAPTVQGFTVGLSSGTSGNRGLFLVSDAERWAWAGALLERLLPDPLFSWHRDRIALFLRSNSNLYQTLDSRRVAFDYFDLLEPFSESFPRLQKQKPTILVAPPSVLLAVAEACANGALELRPRQVISVAEVLEPRDERRLREVFRLPIHQIYQATEGLLATTCPFGTLHLAEDLVHFDLTPLPDQPQAYVPVLSDLYRRTQPMLRYRLDDVLRVRAEPCLCGSVLTPLESIDGRCDDVFWLRTPSGRSMLLPDFVRRAIIVAAPQISDYYVRQCDLDTLEVYVNDEASRAATVAALGELFLTRGAEVPTIRFIDAPIRVRGAKRRRIERTFARGSFP